MSEFKIEIDIEKITKFIANNIENILIILIWVFVITITMLSIAGH